MKQKQKGTFLKGLVLFFFSSFLIYIYWVRPLALYPVQSDFRCSIKKPTLHYFGYVIKRIMFSLCNKTTAQTTTLKYRCRPTDTNTERGKGTFLAAQRKNIVKSFF